MFGLKITKLVQFQDETFGIVRGFLFKEFLSKQGNWFKDDFSVSTFCKYTTAESAMQTYERYNNKHKVVATLDDDWDLL